MKVIYISGPMTGLPENNYPAFNEAAERLRGLGYKVINPADNPEPPCKSWAGFMRMSIKQVAEADINVRLPQWDVSKGANIEDFLSGVLDMERFDYEDFLSMHDGEMRKAD